MNNWYAVIGTDIPDSLSLRMANRPAHIARIRALEAEGRLLLAGPFPAIDCPDPGQAGFTGSLIVAEFESLEAAREWAAQDPYRTSGVYADIMVKPFNKVMP